MSGYAIAQIEVNNPENYKEYLAKVTDIVSKFEGVLQESSLKLFAHS